MLDKGFEHFRDVTRCPNGDCWLEAVLKMGCDNVFDDKGHMYPHGIGKASFSKLDAKGNALESKFPEYKVIDLTNCSDTQGEIKKSFYKDWDEFKKTHLPLKQPFAGQGSSQVTHYKLTPAFYLLIGAIAIGTLWACYQKREAIAAKAKSLINRLNLK